MTHARIGAVLLLAGIASVVVAQPRSDPADLILLNGRVYTVNAAQPWAEGVAVRGGRIVAVGRNADVRVHAGPQTRTIDLGGAFVVPGFNDAHVHIDSTGSLLVGVNLLDVHEPAAFATRVREAAGRLPKGSWITRGDWGAYEKWGAGSAGGAAGCEGCGSGPFAPSRELIDAFTPEHPVFVNRFDRSMFLANSLALKLAGITEQYRRVRAAGRSSRMRTAG